MQIVWEHFNIFNEGALASISEEALASIVDHTGYFKKFRLILDYF